MSEVNRIIALPYLNAITPCVQIGNSLAQPAAAMIEGQPGIGKSAMNASAMQIINADFRDVVLSTHEPADIGGFPWPDKDRVRFMPADWLMEAYDAAKKGRRVCIMLDDYNWAAPATQAASMRMILERRVAGVQLDPNLVRFLDSSGVNYNLTPGWSDYTRTYFSNLTTLHFEKDSLYERLGYAPNDS